MREALKRLVQAGMERTPFRIVRAPENRFQAITQTLRNMVGMGYEPRLVVDGGAHLGDFATLARTVFPAAQVHMVEPQPTCHAQLRELARSPGYHLHAAALVADAESAGTVYMAAEDQPSTGAHIATSGIPVPATTLDSILGSTIAPSDRALIKLDLQGYELEALKGGKIVLAAAEAVLTEVSFYRQAYEPSIAELISFLDAAGYELFDIASLGARPRDNRPHQGDFLFVKRDSPMSRDSAWS